MKRWYLLLAGLGLVAGAASLGNDRAVAQAGGEWGAIKGQVVWGGNAIPERKPIAAVQTNQDKAHCLAKGDLLDEEWVVNPANKGVRWTFVWLDLSPEDKMAKKKLPVHPTLAEIKIKNVEIDQPNCQFIPHAVALREGQNLVAKNSAPVNHNVKWTGALKNPGGNVILPAGKAHTIDNLVTDKYPVNLECNIHPWMKGVVRIYDHPYYAVTDADGKFEIKDAPAGDYRLLIWHASMGYRGGKEGRDGTPIKIRKGEATDLGKYDLKPP
jgi:hypothetical protein